MDDEGNKPICQQGILPPICQPYASWIRHEKCSENFSKISEDFSEEGICYLVLIWYYMWQNMASTLSEIEVLWNIFNLWESFFGGSENHNWMKKRIWINFERFESVQSGTGTSIWYFGALIIWRTKKLREFFEHFASVVSGVGTSICLHILSLSHDRGCPATYTTLKIIFGLRIFFGIFQTYTHRCVALVYNSLLVLIFFPSQATYMSLQLCRHSFWFMFCIMPFMPDRGLIL